MCVCVGGGSVCVCVCVFVCFCVLSCVREGDGHTTTGCELQTHTSFMLHSRQVFKTVSHNFKPHDSWLCSVPGGGKTGHKAREAVIPFITLYCPKVYVSLCTTCINTASAGAAIVVSRAIWHQSAQLVVHPSSTSSRVGSHRFDCRFSALSRVEGWKNMGNGLPWMEHQCLSCDSVPLSGLNWR